MARRWSTVTLTGLLDTRSEPRLQLEVLVIDCQATAAASRGHLLEIGWARVRDSVTHPHAYLIALPDGAQIPPAVTRVTGISEHMLRSAVDGRHAWRELSDQAASLTQQPAPTVIHFARFEQPFLRALAARVFRLDIVCTRDIAQAPSAPSAALQPACARRILRSRGWHAAPKRRPCRSDGVRLARAGPAARDERRVHVGARSTTASPHPSAECPLGPFPSAGMLDEFGGLATADRRALGSTRWSPDPVTFEAGYAKLCATHPELSRGDLSPHPNLLQLGTRLWREGRRDRDVDEDEANATRRAATVWTPEFVQLSLEWPALRAALARRRAIWLTRLFDSSVVWREPGDSCARLIVIENGEVALSAAVDANVPPPIPPGYRRPVAARREAFTLASFDRLRVLTTELKRLIAARAPVALRLGVGPALDESRLASALWWL